MEWAYFSTSTPSILLRSGVSITMAKALLGLKSSGKRSKRPKNLNLEAGAPIAYTFLWGNFIWANLLLSFFCHSLVFFLIALFFYCRFKHDLEGQCDSIIKSFLMANTVEKLPKGKSSK